MSNALNLQEIDQEQALNLSKFFIRSQQNIFLFGRRGVGKQLSLDTEIPTPKGFIKLSDLKEGEQLFDEQGNLCNVIKLHPINLSPESYRIVFDDGTTVDACADHLWLTWDKRARRSHSGKNPTIHSQIRKTKEIFETLKVGKKLETNHSIPCAKPLNYPKCDLLIDPYVLGCWLGDGQSGVGSIESADSEIIDEIKSAGYTINQTQKSINNNSRSFNFSIKGLSSKLRTLNLLKNKHIPDIYMRSSYEQRLALLQGLLDTDGCCLKNGHIEFCSVLPLLVYQTKELISSLGIKCFVYRNESWFNDKQYKDRYRIHLITKLPVFKLKRKLINLKKSNAQITRNTHRYIIDIRPIDPVPMRCITVNSPSNLFLITRSFIATHNTHIALQAAKECNYKVHYINLSVIERPDLAGYPNLHTDSDIVTFKSPAFLPKLEPGTKSQHVILFDEVDKAPPEVTAPLLEILQFKKINGIDIDAVSCILTGNLVNEGAYSNQISTALLDRGPKYILSFNFEKWVDWAKANGVHDLILGFLRSNPEFACGKIEDSCYATPSPRSWTQASEALLSAKELKIVDIESIFQIISGFVGSEAGLRFKIWYEHYRRFEPFVHSLVESGLMTLQFQDLTPTEKVVFVISACYHTKFKVLSEQSKKKNKYLENLCKFFVNYHIDPELQVLGLYNSFDFDMITKHKLYTCQEFFDLFKNISENVSIKK